MAIVSRLSEVEVGEVGSCRSAHTRPIIVYISFLRRGFCLAWVIQSSLALLDVCIYGLSSFEI